MFNSKLGGGAQSFFNSTNPNYSFVSPTDSKLRADITSIILEDKQEVEEKLNTQSPSDQKVCVFMHVFMYST